MKKFIPLLLSLLLMPILAFAQEREFDIEVLIFKRVIDAEKTSESWPDELTPINMDNVGNFNNSEYRRAKGVQMLSYDAYELINEREKLDKHAGFEVLFHKAWRQGDQGRASAPKFHIQVGKNFAGKYASDGSKTLATEAEAISPSVYELDGKLQVYVQHYLFVETALDLRAPSIKKVTFTETKPEQFAQSEQFAVLNTVETDQLTVQPGNLESISPKKVVEEYLKSYRMEQKRRMRSSETHYLDHPLMGVIIQVRRVE